jgi:hypothetical protein
MTVHEIDGWTIHVSHEFPPIPIRSFDYCATLSDYDGSEDAGWQPVGSGKTPDAAIADLLAQIEAYDDQREADEAADMRREERRP